MSYGEIFIIFSAVLKGPESPMLEALHCSSSAQIRAIAFSTCNASFCLGKMDPREVEESIPVNMSLRTTTFGFLCWKSLIFLCYTKFNPSFKSLALLTCITKIPADAVPSDKWWQQLDCLQICSLEELLSKCCNWLSPWALFIESQLASLDQIYWLSAAI